MVKRNKNVLDDQDVVDQIKEEIYDAVSEILEKHNIDIFLFTTEGRELGHTLGEWTEMLLDDIMEIRYNLTEDEAKTSLEDFLFEDDPLDDEEDFEDPEPLFMDEEEH